MEYPLTPDGRYMIVRGRLWRVANPDLPQQERETLVRTLMSARREVKASKLSHDPDRLAVARQLVNATKIGLGERGAVWWHDGAKDFNRHLVKKSPYRAWYDHTSDTTT